MISLRRWKKTPKSPEEGQVELHILVDEIGNFTPEQQVAVARGLAMLWDACLGRFGGLDGFLQADPVDRSAYLEELRSAANRMKLNEALLRSRYALAPKLMVLYLESLLRGGGAAVAREFGQAVATLIEEGDKLRALRKPGSH
jgi:hypothetical protein